MQDNALTAGVLAQIVEQAESGQKLLQLLQRRLGLPEPLLHRWIRTGQIRLNGHRCKPFQRVQAGDRLRLPPFAPAFTGKVEPGAFPEAWAPRYAGGSLIQLAGLPVLGIHNDVWAMRKPAGMVVQPGSGHNDSIADRLGAIYANANFRPVPAHRLDRDTSGVLLVASTFSALSFLHEAMRARSLYKEYLAVVEGAWDGPAILQNYMRKDEESGLMQVSDQPAPGYRFASSTVRALEVAPSHSLLQLRLETGRTHQLRAQLANAGFPIRGDARYGKAGFSMRLHASRIILPDGFSFFCAPDWPEFSGQLPDPMVS